MTLHWQYLHDKAIPVPEKVDKCGLERRLPPWDKPEYVPRLYSLRVTSRPVWLPRLTLRFSGPYPHSAAAENRAYEQWEEKICTFVSKEGSYRVGQYMLAN